MSTLYTLFVNEIPLLHGILGSQFGMNLTNISKHIIQDILQITICYVNDSTAIISSKNIDILKNYIDLYFILVEKFYNINHLKLNPDKTKFMIICPPKLRQYTKNIVINAANYIIEQSTFVKILGIYFTNSLDNTKNVNKIISKVNYRINILKNVIKYINIKTSNMLYKSMIVSVFTYCLPNMINMNAPSLNKLSVLWNCMNTTFLPPPSWQP